MKHVLYNNRWLLPIQGYPQLPALRYCQKIFFFHRVKRKQSTLNVSRERCGEKKCINWLMNIELNFFSQYGTNYMFVVDNSLKKTDKHQLHLLKVKSTEIVIKSCRWDKVSCVRNKATYRRSVTHPGGIPYISLYGEAPLERGACFRLKVYERVFHYLK